MMAFLKGFGNSNKRYFFLLAAVIISLPFQMNFNAFWISLFALNAILSSKRKNFERDKSLLLLYTFYLIYFIFSALSLIYSDDLDHGIVKIQTKLSFLIIPFAFASNLKSLEARQVQWLLRSLIMSVLVATLFCYLEGTYEAIRQQNLIQLYDSYLSEPLMHRAYFSLFLGVSILLWWQDPKFLPKLRIPGIVLFGLTLIFLQGRINILAFLLVSVGIFVFKFAKTFTKRQNIMAIASVVLIIVAYSLLPQKYNRFNQPLTFDYDLSFPQTSDYTGLTIRLAIWDRAIPLIKNNRVLGLGIGDYKTELEKKYNEDNFVVGIEKKFNCHNQYIESYLASGIFSLISLFGILILYIFYSLKAKNIFLPAMVLYFFISMITESLLERHWGISLFCIVIPLYLKWIRTKN